MHLDLAPHAWSFLKSADKYEKTMSDIENSTTIGLIIHPFRLPIAAMRMRRETDNFVNSVRGIHPGWQFGEDPGMSGLRRQATRLIMPIEEQRG